MRKHLRCFDRLTWALIAIALVQFTLVMLPGEEWMRGPSIATIFICAYAAGMRVGSYAAALTPFKELLSTLVKLPSGIALARNEDGEVTALVSRLDGEPLVLRVPDEVAEEGPQAAMAWVVEQTTAEQGD